MGRILSQSMGAPSGAHTPRRPVQRCLTYQSTKLTMQDHALVTLLVKYGIISPEEMDNSPARYTLLRALGEEELKDNEEEGKRGKIQTRA